MASMARASISLFLVNQMIVIRHHIIIKDQLHELQIDGILNSSYYITRSLQFLVPLVFVVLVCVIRKDRDSHKHLVTSCCQKQLKIFSQYLYSGT